MGLVGDIMYIDLAKVDEKGIVINEVSKRLGHSKVSTTQDIYSHLMANSDKKASDSIAEMLYRKKA